MLNYRNKINYSDLEMELGGISQKIETLKFPKGFLEFALYSISEIFARRKEIPPLMTSMIAIGEKTGKIDFMLEHVANFYKSQAENSISNITQIIEPVLILILGVAVAGLVSSILLPIYNLIGAAG